MKKCSAFITALFGFAFFPVMSRADPVRFLSEKFSCELTFFGRHVGRVEPSKPLTTELSLHRETLVECEGHDTPVKVYDRQAVGSFGGSAYKGSSSPREITIHPVAVLPNAVKAAAAGHLDVTAVADSASLRCDVKLKNPSDTFQEESHQVALSQPTHIAKGSRVRLAPTTPMHCGDTNLIEVMIDDAPNWFRNRDFSFSYQGSAIPLYEPSQDYECCWID